MIFIDKLTIFSILKYISIDFKREVYILSSINRGSEFLFKTLKFLGFKIYKEEFFFGNIKAPSNDSIYLSTRRESCYLAFEYSKTICERLESISKNKSKLNKPVIKSFISKLIFTEIEYFMRRINYLSQKSKSNKNLILIINNPKYIDEDFIKEKSNVNIEFCKFSFFNLNKQFIKLKLLELFSWIQIRFSKKINLKFNTTISISSDTIDIESADRHFPHWLNKKKFKNFVILNKFNHKVNLTKNFLNENKIFILKKLNIPYLYKKENLIHFSNSIKVKYLLKTRLEFFYSMANGIHYILKKYKCNKAIFTDPQDPLTDAILLLKQNYDIETFCIQYSNLSCQSPLSLSPVDNYIIFSKHYEKIFKWDDIAPKNFIECGYSNFNFIKHESLNHLKKKIKSQGVKKIISFFDESIQYDKWGLFSYDFVKAEYEFLAKFVKANPEFAVIIKTKFIKYSLAIFKSKIIDEAIQTNRFFELKKGEHRNEILPCQLGSISDYAISNYVGGTSGIEAALAGSNVFFINPFNLIHDLDDIFKKYEVVYDNLEDVINIGIYKENYSLNVKSFLKEIISSKTSIQEILC